MDKHKRSVVKAVLWEFIAFFVATLILYIFSHNLTTSLIVNVLIFFVKVTGLYIYERIWCYVKWGNDENAKGKDRQDSIKKG